MKDPHRREIEIINLKTNEVFPGLIKIARDFMYDCKSYFIFSNIFKGCSSLKEDREKFDYSIFLKSYWGEKVDLWDYKDFEEFYLSKIGTSFNFFNSYILNNKYTIRFKNSIGNNFKKILI